MPDKPNQQTQAFSTQEIDNILRNADARKQAGRAVVGLNAGDTMTPLNQPGFLGRAIQGLRSFLPGYEAPRPQFFPQGPGDITLPLPEGEEADPVLQRRVR